METSTKLAIGTIGVLISLFVIALINPFYTIGAGEKGVIVTFGKVSGTVDPGFHVRKPFMDHIEKINVQIQKEQVEASAASKDMQNVTAVVAVNYRLQDDKVSDLYKNIGVNYKEKVIDPAIQEAVKASTSKYNADELITKRETVREEIKTLITEKLATSYIIVTEVNIVNFAFSSQFNAAIEGKVKAEQDALTSKNQLEQVKYEAQQQIETAKAQAESIKIQAQAINSQGGADYVQLQAIQKWNGQLPSQMVPGSTVPFLNLK